MSKRKKPRLTFWKFQTMKNKTLDDILAFVNGGRYGGYVRKRLKEIDESDDSVTWVDSCFTKKGADAYARLCEILFAVGDLVGTYRCMENIVEQMDAMQPVKRKEA